jgi:hypothetical protein
LVVWVVVLTELRGSCLRVLLSFSAACSTVAHDNVVVRICASASYRKGSSGLADRDSFQ